MNQFNQNGSGIIVPCMHIAMPETLDVCWAGPSPLGRGLCFGSTGGMIQFVDDEGRPLSNMRPGKGSAVGEAVNGLALAGTTVVVSTRADVNFWPLPGSDCGHDQGWATNFGAHGVGVTPSGHVIAPLGRNGIMVVEPPFRPETAPTAIGDISESLNAYRVVGLRSRSGTEAIACAVRSAGIAAGTFLGTRTQKLITATFDGLDVIDVCPIDADGESLAVAALSTDGSVILFRDVIADRQPLTMKFRKVQGTAYRLLCHRGELYVLTSQGIFVLGKLAARFLADELHDGVVTQILPLPMEGVDVNLVGNWLLVVLPAEVRRFDADWIHDHVPADAKSNESPDSHESQDFKTARTSRNPRWTEIEPTARPMQPAA